MVCRVTVSALMGNRSRRCLTFPEYNVQMYIYQRTFARLLEHPLEGAFFRFTNFC